MDIKKHGYVQLKDFLKKKKNQAYGNEFEITRFWQDKKLRDELS